MKNAETIAEFCTLHHGCAPGRAWALENYKTMRQAWEKCPEPEWIVWIATCEGVLSHYELILFSCFCARQNWGLLTDERSRRVVETAEAFMVGKATQQEVSAATRAIYATGATYTTYSIAATDGACAAAYCAADATHAAAHARRAADASVSACFRLARARRRPPRAICAEQADWLREHTKPNFAARKAEEEK